MMIVGGISCFYNTQPTTNSATIFVRIIAVWHMQLNNAIIIVKLITSRGEQLQQQQQQAASRSTGNNSNCWINDIIITKHTHTHTYTTTIFILYIK